MFSKQNLLLVFFLLVGSFLRFSHLDWGMPFYFHPDENNITYAILRLTPSSWNPHFFAYGGLPLYTTYLLSSLFTLKHVTFSTATLSIRFISAFLSTLLIPSLFYIGNKLFGKSVGLIAAGVSTFSIGLIQYAHFGTFEMWLSFFALWFFYYCYELYRFPSVKHMILTGILLGILFSIKVSTLVLFPIPFICLLLSIKYAKEKKLIVKRAMLFSILYVLLVYLVFITTNPFALFDMTSFVSTISYESSVAVGTLPVFYTQVFRHTIPVLFQFVYVYPFLVNPLIELLLLVSICFVCMRMFRSKSDFSYILLIGFFLILFFSQAILFVKWARYIIPTLPFIYLLVALLISSLTKGYRYVIFLSLIGVSFFYSFCLYKTVYMQDSRIAASEFLMGKHIGVSIIEPYDLGTVAFYQSAPYAQISNIYDIDNNQQEEKNLLQMLSISNGFISPSQRLFHSRLDNPKDFPLGNALYRGLFSGTLGYHRIYQTPCDIFCRILYSGNPTTNVEDTANVFDHPIVTIFAKRI